MGSIVTFWADKHINVQLSMAGKYIESPLLDSISKQHTQIHLIPILFLLYRLGFFFFLSLQSDHNVSKPCKTIQIIHRIVVIASSPVLDTATWLHNLKLCSNVCNRPLYNVIQVHHRCFSNKLHHQSCQCNTWINKKPTTSSLSKKKKSQMSRSHGF